MGEGGVVQSTLIAQVKKHCVTTSPFPIHLGSIRPIGEPHAG